MSLDLTTVIAAFIATLPATIAAIGALIVSLRNGIKVEEVHKATNSMKDALVAVTRSDALQEGHAAGVAEVKAAEAGARRSTDP